MGPTFFSLDVLRQAHAGIAAADPESPGEPGQFRYEDTPPRYVTIGGYRRPDESTYNPTPPHDLPLSFLCFRAATADWLVNLFDTPARESADA